MAFGTFSFAFGGHAAFPTIQHDMRRPAMFSRSIFVSFARIGPPFRDILLFSDCPLLFHRLHLRLPRVWQLLE